MKPTHAALWTLCLLLPACSEGDRPDRYAHLEVPETRLAAAEARAHGRRLFLEHCAICHGPRADGRGQRRHSLSKAPVDFTRAAWRDSTDPARLFVVIREGVRGSSMPAWKILDDEQTWDIVAYLLSVAEPPARDAEAGGG